MTHLRISTLDDTRVPIPSLPVLYSRLHSSLPTTVSPGGSGTAPGPKVRFTLREVWGLDLFGKDFGWTGPLHFSLSQLDWASLSL